MKKLLSIILALVLVLSLVSCGKKSVQTDVIDTDEIVSDGTVESDADVIDEEAEEKEDSKETENKKEENKEEVQKPQDKPEANPEEKPENKPEEKPQDTQTGNKTLGNILLDDFKSKVSAGYSVEDIGSALMLNPAIKFNGGAIPVEPGLLSGFDNYEVKGFKSAVMCAPMIGSIAFVAYVFELDGTVDANTFIANLKSNANLRWNICVTADEMVAGSVGNKVFFVMCPTSLEE